MCGICLIVKGLRFQWTSTAGKNTSPPQCDKGLAIPPTDVHHLLATVQRRGPTCTNSTKTELAARKVTLEATGSVLHMRGDTVAQQPFKSATASDEASQSSSSSSWLLWNGEVFGGAGITIPAGTSDTAVIFDRFQRLEMDSSTPEQFLERVRDFLEQGVAGCYALIYYASTHKTVIFGRDPMGRRSLVFKHSADGEAIISSVCGKPEAYSSLHAFDEQGEKTKAGSDELKEKRKRHDATDVRESGENCVPCVVAEEGSWIEVPITGLFHFSIAENDNNCSASPVVHVHEMFWCVPHTKHPLLWKMEGHGDVARPKPYGSDADIKANNATKQQIDSVIQLFNATTSKTNNDALIAAERYLHALSASVAKRIHCSRWSPSETATSPQESDRKPTPITVLFSGGIDCTVIAALTLLLTPAETVVELVNVSCGANPMQAPDRIAAERAVLELAKIAGKQLVASGNTSDSVHDEGGLVALGATRLRFVEVDVSAEDINEHRDHVLNLVYPTSTVMDSDIGTAIWFAAQGRGQALDIVSLWKSGRTKVPSKHYRVGGASVQESATATAATETGDDSSVKFAPLIEVLVFEGLDCDGSDAPTAEAAAANGVLLSTLGKEYGAVLTPHWQSLGYKKLGAYLDDAAYANVIRFGTGTVAGGKTVALKRDEDLQRALAFSKAASAACDAEPYVCRGKCILLGMGADETLGGYTRHQVSHKRGGNDQMASELQRDFEKLWRRNLGRDDRIVADSGREGRFPFIDEDVLHVLSTIPCELVVNPSLGPGIGDKMLLRNAARMIGLQDVTRLQKRAIQFGTKMADRKMKGSQKLVGNGGN